MLNSNNIDIRLTHAESLPRTNHPFVKGVDHVEDFAFAERHVSAGRLFVIEMSPR